MKSKKIIYLVSGLLVLLVFYLVFFTKSGFKVVSFYPTLNNITTITPYIDINFNEPISESDLAISSPDSIVSRYIIESSDQIRVYLVYPLNSGQKYSLVLKKIVSFKGLVINNKTISFTPLYTDSSGIPNSQLKYLVSKQNESPAQIYGTTLVNLLPFFEAGFVFEVNYGMVNNSPTIIITSPSPSGVAAAKTWITNQGYSVSSLNIEIVNQQPL